MSYPAWIEDAYMREPADEPEERDVWDLADEYRDRMKEEW